MREPAWTELTVLFGGTFDPPHVGHRAVVEGLFSHPGAARVVVIPSAKPPHKPAHVESAHRLRMTEMLFGGLADVSVDRIEIDRESSGRPSYSYDTLQEYAKRAPKLAFAIGTDQLRDLVHWHRFPEILDLCHWVVLDRKPDGEAQARAGIRALEERGFARAAGERLWKVGPQGGRYLKILETPAPALSSSEIRRQIALTGAPPSGVLPPEMTRYLKEHRLYGSSQGS